VRPSCVISAGSALDLRALSIVSGRTCWVLCIDALVLTAGGSLLDALSIAVRVSRPAPNTSSLATLQQAGLDIWECLCTKSICCEKLMGMSLAVDVCIRAEQL